MVVEEETELEVIEMGEEEAVLKVMAVEEVELRLMVVEEEEVAVELEVIEMEEKPELEVSTAAMLALDKPDLAAAVLDTITKVSQTKFLKPYLAISSLY